MNQPPVMGITMGDPAGVGPEIICKALSKQETYAQCRPLVLGDVGVLEAARRIVGAPLRFQAVDSPESACFEYGVPEVLALSDLGPGILEPRRPCAEGGAAVVRYIITAIDLAMEQRIQGVVTAPIHKGAMHAAGYDYAGHTELFASRTNTRDYVMMMAGDRLRVVLVTIHTALAQVPGMVTAEKIAATIRITAQALRERFGVAKPRLAVAALNPHASEDGLFGDEEQRVILPALALFAGEDVVLDGPLPADTLFHHALQGKWDAVVCMYHDQGLIPFKMIHFHDGVNTTLGLPIIRTSVDHGTAFDIAGTGKAQSGSLEAAIAMASLQARKRAD